MNPFVAGTLPSGSAFANGRCLSGPERSIHADLIRANHEEFAPSTAASRPAVT
jgi:hypothetical protein